MGEPTAPPPAPLPNVVEFTHVTKRFGDLTVIKDVTFCVPDLPGAASSSPSSGRRAAASRPCCG